MKILITRNTGFYGMGSPLQVLVNGEKKAVINHQQSISLEVPENAVLQVRFFLLKSPLFTIKHSRENMRLTIQMNPRFIGGTALNYLVPILAVFTLRNLLWMVLFLFGVFISLFLFARQAYVIKEENHV